MTPVADTPAIDLDVPDLVHGDFDGLALLRPFNQAGVLAAADVHTAVRLCRLVGTRDEEVALALALAVRAPRVGHVSVDLADIRASAIEADEEMDLDGLPWPEPGPWVPRLAGSGLVALEASAMESERPLVLVGTHLYLQRYWRDEVTVAKEILGRLGPELSPASKHSTAPKLSAAPKLSPAGEAALWRLFPDAASRDQLEAARLALSHRFSVIAGGPGTGKTTTVGRLLAVLFEEAAADGRRLPLVGLAAPTGKAAARMEEAVRAEAVRMETGEEVRAALGQVTGSTLHRLLGTRFDRPGRFRHHRGHRLPHDVVIVDEASMISLSMMASLVQAVRPDARLVLVGDPQQLVSVEAGAVLADIVGPAGAGDADTAPAGHDAGGEGPMVAGRIGDSVALLRRNHRFAGSLARLSAAVQRGADEEVIALLSEGDPTLSWVDADPGELLLAGADSALSGPLHEVRAATVQWVDEVRALSASGDSAGALASLRRHRVLCAHRRGPAGVRAWNRVIQGWPDPDDAGSPAADPESWYVGRPVMVTANDYAMRLFNGDTGVAVALPTAVPDARSVAGRLAAAFDEGADRPPRLVSPTRLNEVDTVLAMTVHKSQGSEFERVTLLMPASGSRLLTRELLYTAITRARQAVTVVGAEDALRRAVRTPIARASGLGARLWGDAAI